MTMPWPNKRAALSTDRQDDDDPTNAELADSCFRESRFLFGLTLLISYNIFRSLGRGIEQSWGLSLFQESYLILASLISAVGTFILIVSNMNSPFREEVFALAPWKNWSRRRKLLFVGGVSLAFLLLISPMFASSWLKTRFGPSHAVTDFMQAGAFAILLVAATGRALVFRNLGRDLARKAAMD
jgi:hypothetical protein